MRNLFYYYMAILIPLLLIVWIAYNGDKLVFFISIIVYFLYRGIIDGNRLYKLGVIEKKDMLKAYNPIYTIKYFKELYFGL